MKDTSLSKKNPTKILMKSFMLIHWENVLSLGMPHFTGNKYIRKKGLYNIYACIIKNEPTVLYGVLT